MGLRIVDYVEIDDRIVSIACAFRIMRKAIVDGVLVAELINMPAIQGRLSVSSI